MKTRTCYPKKKLAATDTQKERLAAKKIIRRETTDRLGHGRAKADNKRLYLCPNHEYETVSGKTTYYDSVDQSGATKRVTFTIAPFLAPKAAGSLNEKATSQSKGSGVERELLGHTKKISLQYSNFSKSAVHVMARETRQEMILDESKKAPALVSPPTTDYKLEHATITLERLIQNKRGVL